MEEGAIEICFVPLEMGSRGFFVTKYDNVFQFGGIIVLIES